MGSTDQLFKSIYTANAGKVYRLCLSYTDDDAAAQDLLQEVFVKVWQNLPKFQNRAAISTWIYRIAVNTCYTYHKKEQRLPRESITDYHESTMAYTDSGVNEQVRLLYKCIALLPDNDKGIITMVLDEEPYDVIADVFNITEQNLRVKIHRIKARLTELYKKHEQL